jgi:hypothetical protein
MIGSRQCLGFGLLSGSGLGRGFQQDDPPGQVRHALEAGDRLAAARRIDQHQMIAHPGADQPALAGAVAHQKEGGRYLGEGAPPRLHLARLESEPLGREQDAAERQARLGRWCGRPDLGARERPLQLRAELLERQRQAGAGRRRAVGRRLRHRPGAAADALRPPSADQRDHATRALTVSIETTMRQLSAAKQP